MAIAVHAKHTPPYNWLFAAHLLPVRTLELTWVQNSCSFCIFDSNKSFIQRLTAFKKIHFRHPLVSIPNLVRSAGPQAANLGEPGKPS